MTEEEKLALIKLTPEQEGIMRKFLSAYDELIASGVRICECDYSFYAFNTKNLLDWRFEYDRLFEDEIQDGWIDAFPFDEAFCVPDLAYSISLDDTLQGVPVNFDRARNLFDD